MVDIIGYVALVLVSIAYAFPAKYFDIANLLTFAPMGFVAFTHHSYPNVLISLFFGAVSIVKVYKQYKQS